MNGTWIRVNACFRQNVFQLPASQTKTIQMFKSMCHESIETSPCNMAFVVGSAQRRLCLGLHMLAATPCAQLRNVSRLESIVRAVGLVNDARGCALYGKRDCASVVRDDRGTDAAGVYQSPGQFAPALVALSELRASTYLEVNDAENNDRMRFCMISSFSRLLRWLFAAWCSFWVDVRPRHGVSRTFCAKE